MESEDTITLRFKIFCALVVVPVLLFVMMLSAVCFDDQFGLDANEIGIVGPDLVLSAKSISLKPASAQSGPESALAFR